MRKYFSLVCVLLITISCAKHNVKPINTNCDCINQNSRQNSGNNLPTAIPETLPSNADTKPAGADYALLKPAKWEDIDGLTSDDLSAAWPAWLQSCSTLINKQQNNQAQWQTACSAANKLTKPNSAAVIAYLTDHFNVYATTNQDGTDSGLITGYYEPLLKGSRTKSSQYPYPLYKQLPI